MGIAYNADGTRARGADVYDLRMAGVAGRWHARGADSGRLDVTLPGCRWRARGADAKPGGCRSTRSRRAVIVGTAAWDRRDGPSEHHRQGLEPIGTGRPG